MKHTWYGRWSRDRDEAGNGGCLLLAFLFLAVSHIGCSDAVPAHFDKVIHYLGSHSVTAVNDKELVEVLDYFISHSFEQKGFLLTKARSRDAKTAITAQVILASLARGSNEISKRVSPKAAHDVLVQIDLKDLLQNSRSISTNGLSNIWIEWMAASTDTLQRVMTEQEVSSGAQGPHNQIFTGGGGVMGCWHGKETED